jgi:YD repeat-containing protein
MRKKIIALTLALMCLAVNAFAASSEPINDAEGNQIGVRILDEDGRVDTEKYGLTNPADPAGSDAAKTVYYFYDGSGNLLVTQTTEKVNDQKSVTRTADGNGNVFSTTESTLDPATGTATSLEYDQNGNLVGKTTYEVKDDRSEIIRTYDAQGNLTGTTEMNEDPDTGDLSWYN